MCGEWVCSCILGRFIRQAQGKGERGGGLGKGRDAANDQTRTRAGAMTGPMMINGH